MSSTEINLSTASAGTTPGASEIESSALALDELVLDLRRQVGETAERVVECAGNLGAPDTAERAQAEAALRAGRTELTRLRSELATAEQRLAAGPRLGHIELPGRIQPRPLDRQPVTAAPEQVVVEPAIEPEEAPEAVAVAEPEEAPEAVAVAEPEEPPEAVAVAEPDLVATTAELEAVTITEAAIEPELGTEPEAVVAAEPEAATPVAELEAVAIAEPVIEPADEIEPEAIAVAEPEAEPDTELPGAAVAAPVVGADEPRAGGQRAPEPATEIEPDIPAPTAADIGPEVALALGVTVIETPARWLESIAAEAPAASEEAVAEPPSPPPPPFDAVFPYVGLTAAQAELLVAKTDAPATQTEPTTPAEARTDGIGAVPSPWVRTPDEDEEANPGPFEVTSSKTDAAAATPARAEAATHSAEVIRRPPVAPLQIDARPRMDNRLKFDLALASIVVLVAAGYGVSRLFTSSAAPPPLQVTIGSPFVGALQAMNSADGGPPTSVSVAYSLSQGSASRSILNVSATGANLTMVSTYQVDHSGLRLTEMSTGTSLGMIVVSCAGPVLMDPSPLRSGATFQLHAACQVSAPDGSTFSRDYRGSGTVASLEHSHLNGVLVSTARLRYSLNFSETFAGQSPVKGTLAEIDVIQIDPFIVLSASTTTTIDAPSGPQTRSTIFWIQGYQAGP